MSWVAPPRNPQGRTRRSSPTARTPSTSRAWGPRSTSRRSTRTSSTDCSGRTRSTTSRICNYYIFTPRRRPGAFHFYDRASPGTAAFHRRRRPHPSKISESTSPSRPRAPRHPKAGRTDVLIKRAASSLLTRARAARRLYISLGSRISPAVGLPRRRRSVRSGYLTCDRLLVIEPLIAARRPPAATRYI